MAETLLAEELDATTVNWLRSHDPEFRIEIENVVTVSNSYDEDDDSEDWSSITWTSVAPIRSRYFNRIPCEGEDIISEDSSEYICDVFRYLAEDAGDIDELSFDDLDDYLSDQGEDMRCYTSVNYLAHQCADHKVEEILWDNRVDILKFYAIDYYESEHGNYIPNELANEIDDSNNYYNIDKLYEVEEIIDDWWDEHDGIEDYMPE